MNFFFGAKNADATGADDAEDLAEATRAQAEELGAENTLLKAQDQANRAELEVEREALNDERNRTAELERRLAEAEGRLGEMEALKKELEEERARSEMRASRIEGLQGQVIKSREEKEHAEEMQAHAESRNEALEGELGLQGGELKPFREDIGTKIDRTLAEPDEEEGEGEAEGRSTAMQTAKAAIERATPRVLTLGADTEMLRREGQRLEAKFGKDAGNGWAFNHVLGKLRLFQEKLLAEHYGEAPSAPSVRDLEDQAEEA